MPYKLTELKWKSFKDDRAVTTALAEFGLSLDTVIQTLRSYVCNAPLVERRGYQQEIAAGLERFLATQLTDGSPRYQTSKLYCPRLNERSDAAIGHTQTARRIFVEIEFRPNVEKDLVKFQIGWNTGSLGLALLILATDRNAINSGYTSMPEFSKFVAIIQELQPAYPLLLCGIAGSHAVATQSPDAPPPANSPFGRTEA